MFDGALDCGGAESTVFTEGFVAQGECHAAVFAGLPVGVAFHDEPEPTRLPSDVSLAESVEGTAIADGDGELQRSTVFVVRELVFGCVFWDDMTDELIDLSFCGLLDRSHPVGDAFYQLLDVSLRDLECYGDLVIGFGMRLAGVPVAMCGCEGDGHAFCGGEDAAFDCPEEASDTDRHLHCGLLEFLWNFRDVCGFRWRSARFSRFSRFAHTISFLDALLCWI